MIIWRPIEEAPKGTGTTDDPQLLLWHKEQGMIRAWWPFQNDGGLQAGVTHFSEINEPCPLHLSFDLPALIIRDNEEGKRQALLPRECTCVVLGKIAHLGISRHSDE